MQTVQLNQPSESFLDEIKLLVGSNGWKSVEDMPRYFDDPRGRFEGFGTIIVLPNSTEQVLKLKRRYHLTLKQPYHLK
jgi:hypothetical protein